MLQKFLSLLDISGFRAALASDSVLTPVIELENNPIALKSAEHNWGFVLFFVCFLVIVNIIGNRNNLFLSLFSRLYRSKDRNSMFYETLANETFNKLFLCLQTILLLSIIIYCHAVHEYSLSITSLTEMLVFIGKTSLVLIVFLLYKLLTYSIAGAIFFKKEAVIQWNDNFFSLISLNGIFLFFPTLIIFYVEPAYIFCIYFIVFYLILNLFFIFYKLYTLFFHGKRHLLYFILYLCAQEIIPLYLVYRGFVYLITQEVEVWM